MALVEVPHGWLDADGTQRADAAHAEHDLLAQPHLPASDVEDVGDRPVGGIVVRHVGVEEEQRHAADLGDPHGGVDVAPGKVDLHLQRQAVPASCAAQRKLIGVDVGLGMLLVAVRVDLLAEVATPIEETHPHERQRRIGGRFQVVAGQDAQAAGVDLHRLVDAVLGAEVGDRTRELPVRSRSVPAVAAVVEVALELVEEAAHVDGEILVGGELRPTLRPHPAQDRDRVAVACPQAGVDAREELRRARRPGPPQVVGEVAEALERRRDREIVRGQRRHPNGGRHGPPMIRDPARRGRGARTIASMTSPVAQRGLDVGAVRGHFPALARRHDGRPAVFLDGPGGTQVPRECIDAISAHLAAGGANTHGAFDASHETDALLADAHAAMADFIGAHDPDEIVFGPNMTTLTFSVSRALGRDLHPGDEIVLTRLDHDGNVAPWLAVAEERGATVRWVDIDPEDCTLDLGTLEAAISGATRIVAVGLASNAVGTVNDVGRIVEIAHAAGAIAYVDAVHAAPHLPIDVANLQADLVVCSPYKFFAPHLGALVRPARAARAAHRVPRPAGRRCDPRQMGDRNAGA